MLNLYAQTLTNIHDALAIEALTIEAVFNLYIQTLTNIHEAPTIEALTIEALTIEALTIEALIIKSVFNLYIQTLTNIHEALTTEALTIEALTIETLTIEALTIEAMVNQYIQANSHTIRLGKMLTKEALTIEVVTNQYIHEHHIRLSRVLLLTRGTHYRGTHYRGTHYRGTLISIRLGTVLFLTIEALTIEVVVNLYILEVCTDAHAAFMTCSTPFQYTWLKFQNLVSFSASSWFGGEVNLAALTEHADSLVLSCLLMSSATLTAFSPMLTSVQLLLAVASSI